MENGSTRKDAPAPNAIQNERMPNIVYKCLVIAFGLTLYFMYILTVGEKIFPTESGSESREQLQQASVLLFVAGCFISQIVFYFLSSFQMGVMCAPISEGFLALQDLAVSLGTSGIKKQELVPTMAFCMVLSALLTSAGFLLLYCARGEKWISTIPSTLSNALFAVLGVLVIKYANERVHMLKVPLSLLSRYTIFNGVSLFLILFFLWLERKKPLLSKYSMLLIAVAGTLFFYSTHFFLQRSISQEVHDKWLLRDPRVALSFSFPSVYGEVNLTAALRNIDKVLGIVFINILQFPLNYPALVAHTKSSPCPRKELLVNAVSCAATSLVGLSSYVLTSSTIAINGAGSNHKADTLLIGIPMVLLFYFVFQYIFYLPFLLFDLLLMYLGGSIIVQVLKLTAQKNRTDLPFILSAISFSFFFSSIVYVTAFTISLYGGQAACKRLLKRPEQEPHRTEQETSAL
ncbi:hypothetical protein NEFER03_2214 [Nematocida sp. LUAm3]|nr:hypothetical protein NEFER03_0626 [Nematocida sp. LUAm3]KAI5171859.1 hypothetical protein NEFER03_1124 [Nematocida sp. LUAm3]KAI5173267.1 hypothetical protein NEFER03_2214 [Nematocida sp. LUAm3]KAI5176434.1 hypothetical protein NEFER02_2197 [Nematocida sp. LUAm2]KAI5179283.1 hypothetical protein NEFER01_2132 [Nematocida sp. LUAm1]